MVEREPNVRISVKLTNGDAGLALRLARFAGQEPLKPPRLSVPVWVAAATRSS
jgi:hypothetical protein